MYGMTDCDVFGASTEAFRPNRFEELEFCSAPRIRPRCSFKVRAGYGNCVTYGVACLSLEAVDHSPVK